MNGCVLGSLYLSKELVFAATIELPPSKIVCTNSSLLPTSARRAVNAASSDAKVRPIS